MSVDEEHRLDTNQNQYPALARHARMHCQLAVSINPALLARTGNSPRLSCRDARNQQTTSKPRSCSTLKPSHPMTGPCCHTRRNSIPPVSDCSATARSFQPRSRFRAFPLRSLQLRRDLIASEQLLVIFAQAAAALTPAHNVSLCGRKIKFSTDFRAVCPAPSLNTPRRRNCSSIRPTGL